MDTDAGDIHILIADGHGLFREGLQHLLEKQPRFRVVGNSGDSLQVLGLVEQLQPDILLLDPRLRYAGGIDVLTSIRRADKPRTIILAADVDRGQASEAFRLGARGVIPRQSGIAALFQCIDAVASGKYWVIREVSADRPKIDEGPNKTGQNKYNLTKRESEIVAAAVSGKSNREIAQQFSISVQTVKHHLTSIFDKVGVYNRLELSLFVIHHGWHTRQTSNGG